jgi:ceramide glucosyltransferase
VTTAIVDTVWWAVLALCTGAVAYRLLAMVAVASWRPVTSSAWAEPPSVTVLKPLCGMEDGLEEAIASFLSQDSTSTVRFVFGVAVPDDPALEVARRLAADYPDRDVVFVVDGEQHGANRKVSNLVNMAKTGLSEVVVISDCRPRSTRCPLPAPVR